MSLLVIANSGRFEKYTEKSPTNTMLEFVGDLTGEIKYNQMKLKWVILTLWDYVIYLKG